MGMLYSPHHSHQARGGLSPGRVNRYEEILPGERNETRALSHGRDPERMQVEASSPPQRHAEPGRDGGGAAEPREHGSAKLSACRIKPHLSEHLWNFLSNVPMNAAVFSVGCSAIRNVGPSNTQRWPPRSPAEGTPWLPRAPGQNPNPSARPPSGWDYGPPLGAPSMRQLQTLVSQGVRLPPCPPSNADGPAAIHKLAPCTNPGT